MMGQNGVLRCVLLNLASFLPLLALWFVHIALVVDHVPFGLMFVVNGISIPILFGAAGYMVVRGPFYVVIVELAVLPIVHVNYAGGDPAKPGLEWLGGAMEFVIICLGFAMAHLSGRYIQWHRGPRTNMN